MKISTSGLMIYNVLWGDSYNSLEDSEITEVVKERKFEALHGALWMKLLGNVLQRFNSVAVT